MRLTRRAAQTHTAERLAAALDTGHGDAETEPLLRIAHALAAAEHTSEHHHETTKMRMLHAFAQAGSPATASSVESGSRDGDAGDVGMHTAEVPLPDGGRVLLADVEPIDSVRAYANVARVTLPIADCLPEIEL